jgi:hypothetical protein
MTPRHYMVPDCISICGTAVAKYASGMIGWGTTQQEHNGTTMPKQEARERYLPLKAGRLTLADTAPQEEPSCVGDFQEAAYMGQTGRGPALCTQIHMWHMCMCR